MIAKTLAGTKKAVIAGAIAVAMLACVSTAGAMSYFTTYAQATGGNVIEMESKTTITEDFSDWAKTVTVGNDGESPAFVRAKAFSSDEHPVRYFGVGVLFDDKGNPSFDTSVEPVYEGQFDGWYLGDELGNPDPSATDGWWYYSKLLNTGEFATPLIVNIDAPKGEEDPFNVIVVHESTIVSNADGTSGVWQLDEE